MFMSLYSDWWRFQKKGADARPEGHEAVAPVAQFLFPGILLPKVPGRLFIKSRRKGHIHEIVVVLNQESLIMNVVWWWCVKSTWIDNSFKRALSASSYFPNAQIRYRCKSGAVGWDNSGGGRTIARPSVWNRVHCRTSPTGQSDSCNPRTSIHCLGWQFLSTASSAPCFHHPCAKAAPLQHRIPLKQETFNLNHQRHCHGNWGKLPILPSCSESITD